MKPENRVTLVCEGPVDPFGNVALIDPERLAELSAFNWLVGRRPHGNYVYRYERLNGKQSHLFLHAVVFGPVPDGFEVDHKNGNTMDNGRDNLRPATHRQNMQNLAKQAGRSSQFKGVCFQKPAGKWKVQARHPHAGKLIHLGLFDPTPDGEIAAARIYDDFARMWFGEFARLNFPNDSTCTLPR